MVLLSSLAAGQPNLCTYNIQSPNLRWLLATQPRPYPLFMDCGRIQLAGTASAEGTARDTCQLGEHTGLTSANLVPDRKESSRTSKGTYRPSTTHWAPRLFMRDSLIPSLYQFITNLMNTQPTEMLLNEVLSICKMLQDT